MQAEDAAALQELRELRQTVQQQSKQIEVLAEQVGKLARALEAQKGGEAAAKPPEPASAAASSPAAPATVSVESPKPAAETVSAAAEPAKPEAIPKADAPPGTKHVVAKGETLTSIAKHYNISIADLKNANKIDNERLLQIGQTLSVPTTKTPEPADKKENP
ncbi:MAG TPA: LysM peptidoglycan-binding domain-containing protein [Chthoniobacter sp.]|nr:LysM peptidoglycan-binding domain-containing protein [Chthoniobacter sp.]